MTVTSLGALEQVQQRFVKLIQTMIVSENIKVKYLCKVNIPKASNLVGAILRFTGKKLDCNIPIKLILANKIFYELIRF